MSGDGTNLHFGPLRRMHENDIAAVTAVLHGSCRYPWSPRQILDSFQSEHHECWIGCDAGTGAVIAYAVVTSMLDECQLLKLCVDRDYQGRGIGRSVLQFLIDRARAAGRMTFFLEVRVSNERAINLYEHSGFTRRGSRKHYYPAGNVREDGWLYSLSL